MVRYSRNLDGITACARGNDIRVSYKNTFETANAIRGMTIGRALTYLNNVVAKEEIIPYRQHNKGAGRKSQCKNVKSVHGRWPEKSCKILIGLIENVKKNAESQKVENAEEMILSHVQVNRATDQRRRTFRAHGRITQFCAHPCHVEIIARKNVASVEAAGHAVARPQVE